MAALHGGDPTRWWCPNLWAGIGLVRGGAGTALVGCHAEVADRIAEYHDLGIDEFILSGYPHLEEAYQVGEGLIPELRRRGLMASPPPLEAAMMRGLSTADPRFAPLGLTSGSPGDQHHRAPHRRAARGQWLGTGGRRGGWSSGGGASSG